MIDLRDLGKPSEPEYICEHCDRRLLSHTDPNRLTRGNLYQCPSCGQIKDDSYDQIKRADTLEPSRQNGAFIGLFALGQKEPYKRIKVRDIDPEPYEDEI